MSAVKVTVQNCRHLTAVNNRCSLMVLANALDVISAYIIVSVCIASHTASATKRNTLDDICLMPFSTGISKRVGDCTFLNCCTVSLSEVLVVFICNRKSVG